MKASTESTICYICPSFKPFPWLEVSFLAFCLRQWPYLIAPWSPVPKFSIIDRVLAQSEVVRLHSEAKGELPLRSHYPKAPERTLTTMGRMIFFPGTGLWTITCTLSPIFLIKESLAMTIAEKEKHAGTEKTSSHTNAMHNIFP